MGLNAVNQRPDLVKGLISVEGGCDILRPAPTSARHSAKVPHICPSGVTTGIGAVGANGDPRRTTCQATVATFKKAGGKAQFLLLPDLGIKGNSHMMMMDNNNLQLADILLKWVNQTVEKNGGNGPGCDRDRNWHCH